MIIVTLLSILLLLVLWGLSIFAVYRYPMSDHRKKVFYKKCKKFLGMRGWLDSRQHCFINSDSGLPESELKTLRFPQARYPSQVPEFIPCVITEIIYCCRKNGGVIGYAEVDIKPFSGEFRIVSTDKYTKLYSPVLGKMYIETMQIPENLRHLGSSITIKFTPIFFGETYALDYELV